MRVHLGDFEQLLLFALLRLGDGAHGAALADELEKRAGRKATTGAIYTSLERLESRGFVSSRLGEPTAQRGGRRKRLYRIEPPGREALDRSYKALRRMAQGVLPELDTGRTG